jgi:hypothetical protein
MDFWIFGVAPRDRPMATISQMFNRHYYTLETTQPWRGILVK